MEPSVGPRDPQTHAIIGAAMDAHTELGSGFLEHVYHEALAIEFAQQGVPYRREVELPVRYKGAVLACGYRADFICFDAIIVELKASRELAGIDEAQVLNYLKATGFERALLLNFGSPRLQYRRIVRTPGHTRAAH